MKTSSAKAKGRRLCAALRDKILATFPDLQPEDVRVVPSGVCGEDLWLSPKARELFPFCVEGKNQENISIWACLKQAESHGVCTCPASPLGLRAHDSDCPQPHGRPLLCFSRNRSPMYVALRADDFLDLVRRAAK